MPETNLFFVYGTLKSGYGNNRLLEDQTMIGTAISKRKYALTGNGIPYATLNDAAGKPVLGEIWQVDDPRAVASLDALEGNGSFYTRHEREFVLDVEGKKVTAWIYEIPRETNAPPCNVDEERDAYYWSR